MGSLSGEPLKSPGSFKKIHVPGAGDVAWLAECLPSSMRSWVQPSAPQWRTGCDSRSVWVTGDRGEREREDGAGQVRERGKYFWRIRVYGIEKHWELVRFCSTWDNSDEHLCRSSSSRRLSSELSFGTRDRLPFRFSFIEYFPWQGLAPAGGCAVLQFHLLTFLFL